MPNDTQEQVIDTEPEQTDPKPPKSDAEELVTLRDKHVQLLQTIHTRGERVKSLEAENVELKKQVEQANMTAEDVAVGQPMRKLFASMTDVPEIALDLFHKDYKVTFVVGKGLRILSIKDGKEPLDTNGKPYPVTENGIWRLTTKYNGSIPDEGKAFYRLFRWFGPSGGANLKSAVTAPKKEAATKPVMHLGLK
jgi:hypothetical protein